MHAASSFGPLPAAGRTGRSPARPWTGTVHALLRHLAEAGFTGCPGRGTRVAGRP
ncbi:hypothetical protein [Nonomuraea ferruginea]|uniref:Uncharacterized protein n=1 Tax=Nonomuraea ferruginea TaxID=46174 RepID=A0ABT4T7V8_9ACTN|nr:hypothetical protein [Nonomuraea ferruginea]MDA0645594.1 hypothetical protein [Nonomuraea ferruginea]